MIPRRSLCARLLFAFLLFALSLVFVDLISAQKDSSSSSQSADGLRVVTLTTSKGEVRVSLPDDMAAGDTISGTVIAEPSGKTDKDKERNAGVLNGYVIELENQKSPVSGSVMRRVALAPAVSAPLLILLDSKGKQIAVTPIVVLPSAPAAPSTVNLPPLGQTGRPLQIQGPFDGDSSNTSAKIGGTDAKVIAESPRKLVVETPGNVVGPSEIKVTENGTTATGAFRNLKIDLTAPKTSLLKGESTELHVQVNGLEGITKPVEVQLQNQSPSNINISGGNTQNIVVQPSQVKFDGTFPWTTNVTGTGNGPFTITAKVTPDMFFPPTSPGTSTPSPTTSPTPLVPAQTKATATQSPAPVTPKRTSPQVFPTPTDEQRFNNSYTKTDTDCCKNFLNKDGAFEIRDDKGNNFKIFRNTLTMKIDGKDYEWEFTQDGKPLYIEWMFCHLNDHMIISQLSSVMVQRVKGGKTGESANTTDISLHGPYRDEPSIRPSYGLQFSGQKLGTGVQEYGVSFSMDAQTCAWTCQLIAEGKIREFRTDPPRPPTAIFNDLYNYDSVPRGGDAYLQRAWWNSMYRLFFEIEDWLLWLDNTEGSNLDETYVAYNLWRTRLENALRNMAKTADEKDVERINEMLKLLENAKPRPKDIIEIGKKFDELHLRYGTKVPPDVRRQIMRNSF